MLIKSVLDSCSVGILILDRGAVHYKNAALDQMAGDGFAVTETGIALHRPEEDHTLQALIEGFIREQSSAHEQQSLLVTRPSGKRPYAVVLRRPDPTSQGSVLITVSDLSDANGAQVELVSGLFSLTPSEARLLRALSEKRDLGAAADVCGVTVGSARQYLKRIFHKTSTASQLELLALVFASGRP